MSPVYYSQKIIALMRANLMLSKICRFCDNGVLESGNFGFRIADFRLKQLELDPIHY
jgi:hypothetical protein